MKKLLFIIAFSIALSAPAYADQDTVLVSVNGLVCDFCARALEKVFSKQDEVAGIEVDLSQKMITVALNENAQLDDDVITKLINDSGYSVVSIRRDTGNINE